MADRYTPLKPMGFSPVDFGPDPDIEIPTIKPMTELVPLRFDCTLTRSFEPSHIEVKCDQDQALYDWFNEVAESVPMMKPEDIPGRRIEFDEPISKTRDGYFFPAGYARFVEADDVPNGCMELVSPGLTLMLHEVYPVKLTTPCYGEEEAFTEVGYTGFKEEPYKAPNANQVEADMKYFDEPDNLTDNQSRRDENEKSFCSDHHGSCVLRRPRSGD
jgi:hypothetical protein